MKPTIIILLFLGASLAGVRLQAQSTSSLHQYANNSNAWIMYFGSHKISDKWGLHLEAQYRRSDFLSNPQQMLLRGGINYYFNGQMSASAGYGFVETYPYGAFPSKSAFPETFFWEQVQAKSQMQAFELVSRVRLEERFRHLPIAGNDGTYAPGDAVYSNRVWFLNRVSLPVKGKVIADNSFYFSVYDDILVNFGKNVGANLFDQNRLYGAIGYKLPKVGRFEAGYMEQAIQKPDGVKIERNGTFQLSLSSNIDFYKK